MQSCDTLVINKSCSVYGQNILAKNSDRPTGEPQPLCFYEGKEYMVCNNQIGELTQKLYDNLTGI